MSKPNALHRLPWNGGDAWYFWFSFDRNLIPPPWLVAVVLSIEYLLHYTKQLKHSSTLSPPVVRGLFVYIPIHHPIKHCDHERSLLD